MEFLPGLSQYSCELGFFPLPSGPQTKWILSGPVPGNKDFVGVIEQASKKGTSREERLWGWIV
jgi:hypothetical protein